MEGQGGGALGQARGAPGAARGLEQQEASENRSKSIIRFHYLSPLSESIIRVHYRTRVVQQALVGAEAGRMATWLLHSEVTLLV